ncbi:SAV_2336 N-terminal domain-related protein [Streptomyces sp. NPDC050564]|uniref:SAV_2336 N-terminal domain-related protein n=1 Tax=Streptomyces sp. NPDC050564 TaxID=3365631 RepID=UPI0037A44945
MSDALTRLVRALGSAPLPSAVDARTLADALWLAASGTADRDPAPPLSAPAEETVTLPESTAPPERTEPGLGGDGTPTGARSRELSVRQPGASDTVRGAPLSLGRANPLPDALVVGRAIQPFRRPWRQGARNLLDIDATVEHYARGGPLVPLFRPAPEPWFEAVVIVDSALSMSVWQETIRAVTRLLTTLGGFRAVHTWRLEWQGDEPRVHDHHGCEVPRERVPHHGSGTRGRRLVLLVSDCAARGWHSPVPWVLLRDWGAQIPVALLDPLPPRLWRRSALNLPPVRVTADRAGEPNRALRFRLPPRLRPRVDAEDTLGPWSALPVVSWSPNSLGAWASTLMRADPRGCDAVLIPATGRLPRARNRSAPARQTDPTRLAEAFVHTAPTPAVRLAVLCSELPELPLPLLHILRDEAVPEARYSDLAELLTSGLFTVRRDAEGDPLLALSAPARAHLRTHLTTHDAWHIRAAFSRHATAHPYAPGGVATVLHDPTAARQVPAQTQPFAETATAVRGDGGAEATRRAGATPPATPEASAAATTLGADEASATYEAIRAQMQSLFGPPTAPSALRDTELLLRHLIDYTYHRLPAPLGGWPYRNTLFDDLRPIQGRLTLTHVISDLRGQLSEEGIDLEGPTRVEDALEQDLQWRTPGAPLRVTLRMETTFSWPRVMQAARTTSPRTPVVLSPVEFLLVLDDSDKPGGLQPLGSCVALVERTAPRPGAVVVFRVQTRLSKVRRESRDALAKSLRELHHRAGAPTYASLVWRAEQASPPVHLTTSTLSDWFRGKAVPADERSFNWLVHVLAQQAGPDSDGQSTAAALNELRDRALQKRREEPASSVMTTRLGQPIAVFADRAARSKAPRYIERSHDRLLRAVVSDCVAGASRLVLLVGPPGSGKSRSAWEAARHLPDDWSLWEPQSSADLEAALDTPARIGARTVIWLGDAERHLLDETAGGRGERVAEALRARLEAPADGPVLMMGTVRTEPWYTLTSAAPLSSPDRHQQARALCLRGVAIPVPSLVNAPSLSYLTSGADAIERYTSAPSFVRAFVDAAIDARRYGHGPTIPGVLLSEAALGYLRHLDKNTPDLRQLSIEKLNSAGLIQVARPDGSVSSLGSFRLSDHIEQYGREIRRHSIPPESLWDALARNAAVPDLEAIARTAEEQGDSQLAERFQALATERRKASTAVQETTPVQLRQLLERTDLGTDEARAVADQALDWLSAHDRTESAQYVLTALVSRPDLPRRQTTQAIQQALDWLTVHGQAQDAQYLLRSLLTIPHLAGDETARTLAYTRTWLAAHGDTESAQFVLSTALLHEGLSQEDAHFVVNQALHWLDSYGGSLDSAFVQSAALRRNDLPSNTLRQFVRYALDWLRSVGTSAKAQLVLYRLLQRTDLAPEETREATALALRWLEGHRHDTDLDAQLVLRELLKRTDLGTDEVRAIVDQALDWLTVHGQAQDAQYLLSSLLAIPHLAGDETARTLAYTRTWLAARGDTKAAQFVLSAALLHEGLSQEDAHFVVNQALHWLDSYGDSLDSAFVQGAALRRNDLPSNALRQFVRYALDWLRSNGASPEAQLVLYPLLQRIDLAPEETREATALALRWLRGHGHDTDLDDQFVLSAVLSRDDLTPVEAMRAGDRALDWLHIHGAGPSAQYVLRPLLLRTDLGLEVTTRAVEAGRQWSNTRNAANESDAGIGELARTRAAAVDSGRNYLILVVDIAGFAAKSVMDQMNAHSALNTVLTQVLSQDESPPTWERSDRGDGQIIVFEPGTRTMALAPDLLTRLERALHDLHRDASLRLRLALHCGDVAQNRGARLGQPVVTATRLVDSQPLQAALNAARNSPAAVAISDTLFHAAFADRQDLRNTFRPVYIQSKEGAEKAWVSVAGYKAPPAIEAWSRPPEDL